MVLRVCIWVKVLSDHKVSLLGDLLYSLLFRINENKLTWFVDFLFIKISAKTSFKEFSIAFQGNVSLADIFYVCRSLYKKTSAISRPARITTYFITKRSTKIQILVIKDDWRWRHTYSKLQSYHKSQENHKSKYE